MRNVAKMYKPYLSTSVSRWREYKYAGIRVEVMEHALQYENEHAYTISEIGLGRNQAKKPPPHPEGGSKVSDKILTFK